MSDNKEYIKLQADKVSNRLCEIFDSCMPSVVTEAMKYSVEGGGKRVRPLLTLEFSKALGGNLSVALDFGCAVELIHSYSLIHDDLPCMDNDDMRRGKPSCHIAFGEDNALLAGDALLTAAFSVASKVSGIPDKNIVTAIKYLSEFAGINGMVGGQVLDLQFEKCAPSLDEVIKMYSLKTCALLKLSAVLGCLTVESCNDEIIGAALTYGENLGLAFQIVDDILDIEGDEKTLGKPVGSDEKNDKNTAVKLMGIEKAKEYAKTLTQNAVNALDKLDADTAFLKDFALSLLNRTY